MTYAITLRTVLGKRWAHVEQMDEAGFVLASHMTESFETVDACLHAAARWIAEQEAA